ncbi:MAG: response regulator [Desulfobulbales bacterium]|nr:response regulator [Desulfobulbales bacterium]
MEERKLPVLIVEDDEALLNLYEKILEKDYDVLKAASGKEAFEIFQEHPEIPVVMTDVLMETDIAGIELINRIIKVKPATQFIIVSTAHEDSFIALQTLKGIASLPKPVESMHIKMAVRSACIRYKEAVWLEGMKNHLGKAPWQDQE